MQQSTVDTPQTRAGLSNPTPQWTGRFRTRRTTWASAAIAATASVLLLLGFAAAPAQAVWWQSIKRGALCMFLALDTSTPVSLNGCGLVGSALKRVGRGAHNGHRLIQIKLPSTYPYCLDSRAQRTGYVRSHPCNRGSYQLLEVFAGSKPRTVVLKSLGAWQHQRVHICISSGNAKGSKMKWAPCHTRSTAQQFRYT
ncbi:hypothetical protein [Actinoplanes aureus]|uniref:Ricin B lectin domain-containing protein n=1 Tax=Actinoplanes aureus TaxID=2792083 RepID=A0A931CKL4_9ACTN|nr:hypothetical protein [Actinoplanes aureus]MBG0569108.1 hypothetical protein [Actinoplanes aureus]MBG0569141.1 hypothetical protein [Actinoplanes aureus]